MYPDTRRTEGGVSLSIQLRPAHRNLLSPDQSIRCQISGLLADQNGLDLGRRYERQWQHMANITSIEPVGLSDVVDLLRHSGR